MEYQLFYYNAWVQQLHRLKVMLNLIKHKKTKSKKERDKERIEFQNKQEQMMLEEHERYSNIFIHNFLLILLLNL